MYSIQLLDEAIDELSQIDKPIAKRITKKIKWLSENIEDIQPEGLTGDLTGLYKLRVGSYRVIYEILEEERLIIIHAIGHRSKIYKR
ncbi:MAG TPA: type II toxin-antitoxin system RelE/ParE family toxin [Nitrospirae bacterium]|nr:type II toxin-antitoxin system RelE/ParE family toxin [Nitrospirota bacterium]